MPQTRPFLEPEFEGSDLNLAGGSEAVGQAQPCTVGSGWPDRSISISGTMAKQARVG